MKKFMLVLLVSSSTWLSATEAKQTITYVGSSTVGKFMHAAVEVYDQSSLSINTKPESGGGETAVAGGHADLGGVAREVKPDIVNSGVEKYLVGYDAIGVWVNAENPVNSLTKAQLADIFTGKVTNWRDVGGEDRTINVYIVNPQSATRSVFKKIILGEKDYGGKNIRTVRPDTAVLEKTAADRGTIGQLSFALGSNIDGCKKIAIGDQEASVHNPEYPITRPLYLITKGEAQGHVKQFIDWAVSDTGQAVVKRFFVGRR